VEKIPRQRVSYSVLLFKYIKLIKISGDVEQILRMYRKVETPKRKMLPARSRHTKKGNSKTSTKKVSL
jgi:hypothetical protein